MVEPVVSKPFIIVTADQILDCVDIAQRTCDAQQAADYLNAILNEWGTRVGHKCRANYTCEHDKSGMWSKPKPHDTHEALLLGQRGIDE